MNTTEIRELSQALNTSTSEWVHAYMLVVNEYHETGLDDIENFVRQVIEKRDQAQALLDILFEEQDRIHRNITR